ncbi:proteasome subunit beta [Dactylosporangium vinaceum]|uniref:Proteasome subunit beta n=1 Tax=Dactylosporangium vinaceum TaxID=53362 RepID=A0ABV5MIU2_9ACTN|nr:proteasome subunit beta [Dactylosporangium vinaceum]UAB93762.1 proteasome subunit beta [Dactylosporangium vinaceum]
MPSGLDHSGRPPAAFHAAGSSSFTEFLSSVAPELLPGRRPLPPGMAAEGVSAHATTIVAIACTDGVLMGGDRRATMGNLIAQRDIEKVFAADAYSLVGMAGTAGFGLEMIRLFQVELEHYEKIESSMLSLEGKANRLASMVRNNLGAAMQGLAVVPLFAGFDVDAKSVDKAGRIFSFDVAGGVYEERGYDSIGSGSLFAKSSLKKRYRPGVTTDEAVKLAIEALYDAADDDTATGGPDLLRNIFPVIMTATVEGTRRYGDDETRAVAEQIIAERSENPTP